MILIEKLKTHNPRPQIGLVDLLHNDNTLTRNMLGIYPATHLLKSYIENQLKNISIGCMYGSTGIDINTLLVEKPDIIIETSYRDLKMLPFAKKVRLLEQFTVMLTDFEESGAIYGCMDDCLISYLNKLNITPKQIISVTGGFNQVSYNDLNIHCLYIPIWVIFTILANKFYINLVFDRSFKEQQRTLLSYSSKKFGLFPNRKPRLPRVSLLAELEHKDLLNLFDWSLVYSKEELGNKIDYGHFINNFESNSIIEKNSNDKIKSFLSNHSFPKVFVDSKHETTGDCVGPADAWFGKYKYYVSAETCVYPGQISFGTLGDLTEKTFKAMCIGAYPFVLGVPGSEDQLRGLGFRINDYGYDNLLGYERIVAICNIIEQLSMQPDDVSEIILHNFDLITSPAFLARLVTEPLNCYF